MISLRLALVSAGVCLLAAAPPATILRVDAREQPAPPETGWLKMGTSTAPDGRTLTVNSRYLTRDSAPWLPVMGEFHFARVPRASWEEELAKMKAAGVDIVSTYVFWNFTEKTPGRFDWSGDLDLRAFVTLCGRLGLDVFVRPGPWVHSEDRFGGLPDWVVHAMPTRESDPEFLHYVARWYDQVGAQLKGLLWKDGGPVIGVQLANEYAARGPERGDQYILDLKRLALAAGLDVPLYTVTGWDNAVVPPHEVIPVEGGYADEPWGLKTTENPPSEVYALRFQSRVRGTFDAARPAPLSDADRLAAHVPFFGAEFGGGVPTMYRRRPILRPADVAAMLPVQLGSGANLYGYYMFHGGRITPPRDVGMQEATAIGGYNDLPMIDYDFQAPLGAYGQQHPVMGALRPLHFFLNAFGSRLAPMAVHQPEVISKGQEDLVTPRWSVRTLGTSGFLFFDNHVRQYAMAVQRNVRFAVELPGGTLTFPSEPVTIPTDAYFIWPIGMDLSGARLAWATAQPVTEIEAGRVPVYVFMAQDGIPAELAFDQVGVARVTASSGRVVRVDGRYLVRGVTPGAGATVDVRLRSGKTVRVIVLTAAEGAELTLPRLEGARRLMLTSAQAFTDGDTLTLLSTGQPDIHLAVYPPLAHPAADLSLTEGKPDGVFQVFDAHAAPRTLSVTVTPLRGAQPVPPLVLGAPQHTAHEPTPEVFGRSAAWTLTVHGSVDDREDAFLRIYARGDVARLFSGVTMLDDQFLNGSVWEIGLKNAAGALSAPLTLTILPLRKDAPIYLDQGVEAMVQGRDQLAAVDSVTVVPQFRLDIAAGPAR